MRPYLTLIAFSPLALTSAFVFDKLPPQPFRTSTASLQGHNDRNTKKLSEGRKSIHLNLRRRSTVLLFTNKLKEKSEADTSDAEDKLKSFKDDIEQRFIPDRTYDNMGLLMPIAEKLDEVTGDWALSYADLSPATPKTPAGISFLLTNVCYAFVGIILISQGDFFYGSLVEIAGAVSFWYHYSQLEFGKDRSEVRLALLTDYFTAGSALITGGFYMVDIGLTSVPMDALICSGSAIVALSLCWVWEFGYPYLFLHSIWHILSAYTGYLIGQAHIDYLS